MPSTCGMEKENSQNVETKLLSDSFNWFDFLSSSMRYILALQWNLSNSYPSFGLLFYICIWRCLTWWMAEDLAYPLSIFQANHICFLSCHIARPHPIKRTSSQTLTEASSLKKIETSDGSSNEITYYNHKMEKELRVVVFYNTETKVCFCWWRNCQLTVQKLILLV